jgi:glycosyltransferase involved in cell wall biosynthesis
MTATTPRISIVVATANRPTLRRALRSCRWADEIVVVFDAEEPPWHPPGCVVLAHGPTRVWGHPQRNVGIEAATGTHVAFMDDDDLYTRGAGDLIRTALAASPDRVHVFCMRNRDKVYRGPVESGKIGTPMFVVPIEPVGTWTTRYSGDLDFITETMRLRGDEPVFHPEVIANINPPTLRSALRAAARPASWKRVASRVRRRLPARRRAA